MLMISAKEYLLLSFLSYCNFTKKNYKRNLYELWQENNGKNFSNSAFMMFQPKFHSYFLAFFEEELKAWSVVSIDTRRAKNLSSSQSGFYAVCFKNKKEDYVLSFRGSEIIPIEDAYLDFVSTDLAIGMGKIPIQFHEGVEVYEKIVQEFQLEYSQLSLTGHSLGGGIAQYVALSVDRLHHHIPKTCTWNAVGINKKGIVHIGEFLNLQEILDNIPSLNKEQRISFLAFAEEYQDFFGQEYEKMRTLKEKNLTLDSAFFKRLYAQTKIESYIKLLSSSQQKKLLEHDDFWNKLFDIQNFYQKIKDGEAFMNKIHKNKSYQEKIVNYGHSSDLTHSLFPHIGLQCLVDRNLTSPSSKKESFFDRIQLLKKSFISCHSESVFLPFFGKEEESQLLKTELSTAYLAAMLRKLLQQEKLFTPELLATYYSREPIPENQIMKYKQQIIQSLKKYTKVLYCNEMRKQMEALSEKDLLFLWKEAQNRMASPYRYEDIFDVLAYEYC